MKRGLKPIDVMSTREREEMYSRTHSEVRSHQFESQTIRLLKKEKKERAVSQELANKLDMFKEKSHELEEKYRQMALRQEEIKEKEVESSQPNSVKIAAIEETAESQQLHATEATETDKTNVEV